MSKWLCILEHLDYEIKISCKIIGKIIYIQDSPPAWTQEAYRPLRGKHMFCYHRWGGVPTLVGERVPTLVGGYLLWWGGTYPGRGGTYPGGGVPTLAGGYIPWWGGTYPGGGVPTLVGGTYPGGGVPT